ncbi:hypothetical protein [Achromobacter sp. AGC39]
MKTCEIEVSTGSIHKFLNALEENDSGYSFVRAPGCEGSSTSKVELELWVDNERDPMRVTLHPDGTWSATSELIVSKED